MHSEPSTRTLTAEVFPPGIPPDPQSLEIVPPAQPSAPTVLPAAREPRRYDPRTTPDFTPFACSEEIAELVAALSQSQLEFDEVERNKTAHVESKRTGAKYSYDYADLSAVIAATRPQLSKHGLVIIQMPRVSLQHKTCTIMTLLTHTSGQWMRGDLPFVMESLDPQSIGSAITYGRRYAQQALLNLAPESDDDGATASRRPTDRPGQGPVQMPQRAESVSPPQSATAPAPAPASTTEARHTPPATPAPASGSRWINGPLTITHLQKEKGRNGPYWRIRFSDDTVCAFFPTPKSHITGEDLETWRSYDSKFGKAKVTTKGEWTYLDELKPFDGPAHPGQ